MRKNEPKNPTTKKTLQKTLPNKKQEKVVEEVDLGPHIFEILEKNVTKNFLDVEKRTKAFLIDYTLAILKPSTISLSKNCKAIVDKIEIENFEIFYFKLKTLTEQEVQNLYWKHVDQDYYNDIMQYMTSGPVAIMVLVNKTDSYLDTNGIKTSYLSPVIRWKNLIGNKDPTNKTNVESLRAIYGTDIIRNEFWGSDSAADAYRELSIFQFPVPVKPPEFKYDKNKIKPNTIHNFLFPIKPNNPDVSGRLDLFAKYGPVVNNHIYDICVCIECRPKIKQVLKDEGKTLKISKEKIITEEFIVKYLEIFCKKCIEHFNTWSHLFSGFEETHLITNEEIDMLIMEMNREDLLKILRAEKGSSAETVLSKININSMPKENTYTKRHVEKLLELAEVDYYDRFEFKDLQNIILEDRRIRMNYWVHKIIGKPPEAFKNPKLINAGNFSSEDVKSLHDPKSKNFTFLRILPLQVVNEDEEKLKLTLIQDPIFLKQKLTDHEINQKVEKLLSHNLYKVSNLEHTNSKAIVSNMILLRNYELETIKEQNDKNILKNLTSKNKK